MKTWARKTLSVGVLAAGALLLAPAAANADTGQDTSFNRGVLTGNNVAAEVLVPINAVGNSIGILGDGYAAGSAANHIESGKRGKGGAQQQTSWNRGLGSGNNVFVKVLAPVNVVGNAAGILGSGEAAGAASNHIESGKDRDRGGNRGDQDTRDNRGVLTGNNVAAPITAPINVCGNSIGLLGFAEGHGACANFVKGGRGEQSTRNNRGLGTGNNVALPIHAPINLTGNAIGDGEAHGASTNLLEGGSKDRDRGGNRGDQDTRDNRGFLTGNNIEVPIQIPINACGNALAILGYGEGNGSCSNDLDRDRGNQGGGHHGGNNGDDDDNDGDNGGHHGGGHNNGGDNGDDDGDYLGDGGSQGEDDGDYTGGGRKAQKTEATAIDGLTQSLTNAGGLSAVGGLLGSK